MKINKIQNEKQGWKCKHNNTVYANQFENFDEMEKFKEK